MHCRRRRSESCLRSSIRPGQGGRRQLAILRKPAGGTGLVDLANNYVEGYVSQSGFNEFAVTLDSIQPQLYPGLQSPGYLLAIMVAQSGGDALAGTALLVDSVRLVANQAVP